MSSTGSDDVPQSVEEAGALLGAAITRCGVTSHATTQPPKGMHSSFATVSPVPSSGLFMRLHSLRALLRSAPANEPLVAAPSLLAVLMKLLGVSNSLAAALLAAPTADRRATTPPMLSTPLRQLWVDCVVLCHSLGEGLSGAARIDVFAFVRNMMALAGMNPKSAKAAGGTRIAALQVIGGLFVNEKLTSKLAPWALDVLQLCHRSLKSSGNGEPTYRITSVQTACCVAISCRQASLATRPLQGSKCLIIRGAMEDGAITEATKLLRHATLDKFPEVRNAAANFASIVAPMLFLSGSPQSKAMDGSGASSATSSLEDVLVLAMKNLDDEMTGVAVSWADAAARCMCSCIAHGQELRSSEHSGRRNAEDDGTVLPESTKTSSRKASGLVQQCSTLGSAISYLVDHFVKVGGELAAHRQGGSFSSGGRAVRIGISLTLVKLLGLESVMGNIGQGRDLSIPDVITAVLNMVGPEWEKQIRMTESRTDNALDATSASVHLPEKSSSSLFSGPGRHKSHADAGLARIATCRVLREGVSEMAPETTQLSILHELIALCDISDTEKGDDHASKTLTSHQLQVVLIEISHLLTTLGEAAASSLRDLIPALQSCLGHPEHGVRHEAAIACVAMAGPFPTEARKLFRSSVDEIQLHHAELVKLASMGDDESSRGKGQQSIATKTIRKTQRFACPSFASSSICNSRAFTSGVSSST